MGFIVDNKKCTIKVQQSDPVLDEQTWQKSPSIKFHPTFVKNEKAEWVGQETCSCEFLVLQDGWETNGDKYLRGAANADISTCEIMQFDFTFESVIHIRNLL